MRLNARATAPQAYTHEGAPAYPHLKPEQILRRSVLACLLFEDEFYEDGIAIADRITSTAEACAPETVAALAIEARSRFHLRHAPLLLLATLCRTGRGSRLVSDAIAGTIQRPDEIPELLAIYWRKGRTPLSAQLKLGIAGAYGKFDAYQIAKYRGERDAIKLRDPMRLTHPRPGDDGQAELWRRLVRSELDAPDTWEVGLSGGRDRRETFERLLREGKLGYLALLRNLRGMAEAGVDEGLMKEAILARKGAGRVLPFRYVAAARACPRFEREIDEALLATIGDMPSLQGRTVVVVDVSGSMDDPLSRRSDLRRVDAAAALAAIVPGDVRVFSFSAALVEVPPRRGMAGVDAVINSQRHTGTHLGAAVQAMNDGVPHDRLIVVTDEQSHDRVPDPRCPRAYMINVGSNRNGVGYGKRWVHVDGFSEAVLTFIREIEDQPPPEENRDDVAA